MASPFASLRTMSRAEAGGTEPGGEAVSLQGSGERGGTGRARRCTALGSRRGRACVRHQPCSAPASSRPRASPPRTQITDAGGPLHGRRDRRMVHETPLMASGGRPAATGRIREFCRRRRTPITIGCSLLCATALVVLLSGRREDFATAITGTAAWVLAATALLQVVALVARSEAWHLTVGAAGATISRRTLYRASSMQVLGSLFSGHLGVAARIAALRRSSGVGCPRVPTLIAAEVPILAVEAALAALASFTLIGPLGLPWWLPPVAIAAITIASAGLRRVAVRAGRGLRTGLAI